MEPGEYFAIERRLPHTQESALAHRVPAETRRHEDRRGGCRRPIIASLRPAFPPICSKRSSSSTCSWTKCAPISRWAKTIRSFVMTCKRQKLNLNRNSPERMTQLADLWAQWDAALDEQDEPRMTDLKEKMVSLLDRRRYVRNLVRDVNQALGI